jgi:hypothetical protein
MLAAIFVGGALSCPGQDYEYQFTAPITGSFQQGACDPSMGFKGTGYLFYFGTLSETVYYNPTANTLQQIGSFTLTSTSFSGTFEDDKTGQNSTTAIPATVSVDYLLNGGNNTVSFNSGVQPVSANPALNWSILFTEAITVTTGGESYSDVLSGSIPEASTITSISQFSPGSIVISQGYPGNMNIYNPSLQDTVSAADGWSSTIVDGIGDASLPENYQVGPVTAYAVPEPGSLTMFSLGAFGLMFFFRRRRGEAATGDVL